MCNKKILTDISCKLHW